VLRSIFHRFIDCFSMVSVILFPLGDNNVISGYLLFPSKFVLYLASWCIDLSDACDLLAIAISFQSFSGDCWRLSFDKC